MTMEERYGIISHYHLSNIKRWFGKLGAPSICGMHAIKNIRMGVLGKKQPLYKTTWSYQIFMCIQLLRYLHLRFMNLLFPFVPRKDGFLKSNSTSCQIPHLHETIDQLKRLLLLKPQTPLFSSSPLNHLEVDVDFYFWIKINKFLDKKDT